MKFFESTYVHFVKFTKKKKSWIFLSFISFIESIFFPLPTDIFLAPAVLFNKQKVFFLTVITIFFSVLGGVVGYLIGQYLWSSFSQDVINFYPKFEDQFGVFKNNFSNYGWFLVIIGGFTPMPYKIVAISSGILNLNLLIFIICSVVSRGARFAIVSFLFFKYGKTIKEKVEKNINFISFVLIFIFIFYLVLR
tara:strand:- start:3445 stop:4023 length:579 start_codon:yes stop_codon:yes gene_type:complete